MNQSINQPMNQLMIELINLLINQSIMQSIKKSIKQAIMQSIYLSSRNEIIDINFVQQPSEGTLTSTPGGGECMYVHTSIFIYFYLFNDKTPRIVQTDDM